MKIAIHHRERSFSTKWIEYCKTNNIDFKLVNCYDSDIIDQLHDCDGLLWHLYQEDYRDVLISRQLTMSLERIGKKVFPDSNTAWHFDDKIGQKYLLEAVGLPFTETKIFFEKKIALDWIRSTKFPKVFKLSKGAGSVNTKLVSSKGEARRLTRKAFQRGFQVSNRIGLFGERIWHLRRDRDLKSFIGLAKGFVRLFLKTKFEKFNGREKGYIYFQEFIKDNTFDTRIIVIGNRAFGIRRYCRKGDFRASGSGIIEYSRSIVDTECVKIAFIAAEKLNTQCCAFDFVYRGEKPQILEISFGFVTYVYDDCTGYYDKDMNWIAGPFIQEYFIMEDFINSIKQTNE